MKILYLLSQRPDSTGSGFYVQALIREASKAGHDCFLVSGISGEAKPAEAAGLLPDENYTFARFEGSDLPFPIPGMSDVMPYHSTRFKDMTSAEIDDYKKCFKRIILEAVEAFQPDIIHSNHLWIMSGIARELFPEIPMIASCHGTDLRQLEQCVHLKNEVIASCRKIDRIIALSETQKKEISSLFGVPEERITVAGSGFNDQLFTPGKKPVPPPVKLLYAGKLSASKGVPWLLESLNHLIDLKTPFHLNIAGAGTGDEYETCLRLAGNQENHVTLCGALQQSQLADLMRQSHIFILPSFFEGLPLVLFEALASGCKIITTALPGSKEIAGTAGSDLIRFIELPELETIDSPFQNDMPMLIEKLAGILIEEIDVFCNKRDIEQSEAEKITVRYTWSEVFKRIETAYQFA